jgi:hypothetical protein
MTATLANESTAVAESDFVLHESKQTLRPADFSQESLVAKKEFEIELTYAHTVFPVEGSNSLHVMQPLRLGYSDEDGTLDVIGWGLRVDLRGAQELPRLIARRFLTLYSKLWNDNLSEEESTAFRNICEQIDYRGFARTRELPRYREAKLIHKVPCYVEFLDLKRVQIDSHLVPKFHVLDEGDLFGAWFTTDLDGKVVDIKNVMLLPTPPQDVAAVELPARAVDFPPSLKSLLPDPDNWELDENCS